MGNGCYFAVKSSYSHNYAKCDANGFKKMFRARVLVGEATVGNGGVKGAPKKSNLNNCEFYDSTTDRAKSIYCIFNDNQSYPEYLITYK